ncbi:TetR/AcrR family transcriptional regulator [Paenibacillus sp. Marseille-Q4541]|uniref:TetR/AcrR family transcriptional regulator n=1 Tax=Paenibacillus sp. Marseille-Q4541 TaxID=2831522 RepID=UPI0032D59A88
MDQVEKQEAILQAGYHLFGIKGFYETKMSEIAEEAGIAKGTIYLYFKNKEALFTAVTRRDCERFLESARAILENSSSHVQEKLLAFARNHLTYYYERRQHTKLFFMIPNNDPELMNYMKQFLQEYMFLVQELLTDGGLPEPELYAVSFIGILDRHKMDIMVNPNFGAEELEKRVAFASNLFINGCGEHLSSTVS